MGIISVTVAAILERDGRFLVVEEQTDEGVRINQPAGHLEPGESILAGVQRETSEESAYRFEPSALVGIYRWHYAQKDVTYVRFAVCGTVGARRTDLTLNHGILRALWLTPEQLRDCASSHRSALVMRCVDDYLTGRRYPLEILVDPA